MKIIKYIKSIKIVAETKKLTHKLKDFLIICQFIPKVCNVFFYINGKIRQESMDRRSTFHIGRFNSCFSNRNTWRKVLVNSK